MRARRRDVLVHTQHGGRRCPEPLTQNMYCAYSECYQWQASDWGPCQTEVSQLSVVVYTVDVRIIVFNVFLFTARFLRFNVFKFLQRFYFLKTLEKGVHVKIGRHLPKLEPKIDWHLFSGHGVYCHLFSHSGQLSRFLLHHVLMMSFTYLYCRLTDAATGYRHVTLPAYVTMTSSCLTRSVLYQLLHISR